MSTVVLAAGVAVAALGWLVLLIVSGFSSAVVGIGLLPVLMLLGSDARR
jgi:hypothetical protein